MSHMKMIVDTAIVVPVSLVPIVGTDGLTIQAVAYNAAGMDLRWNFATPAGVVTSTPFTPTTAGVHDWTDLGDGICSVEIPASGGTVNNDTEGFGWISGKVTASMAFSGPVVQLSPANIVNSSVVGSDLLQVDLAQVLNSTNGVAGFAKNIGEIYLFTVTNAGFSPTATEFECTLTDSSGATVSEATANHFVDCIVAPTTGALRGKRLRVNAYSLTGGRPHFTVTDKGEAFANGDTGILF